MEIHFSETDRSRLRALGVVAAYLFGSRAVGKEGPLSDFDFGFLMRTAGHKRGGETHEALYDILIPLCQRLSIENDVIDIVFLNDAPLELRSHVIRYGTVLFDDDPLARGRFEQITVSQSCDFRPLLEEIDQTILSSL